MLEPTRQIGAPGAPDVAPTRKVTFTRLSPTVGAQVHGADVERLDEVDFAAIEQAWYQHHVLRFRDQSLSKDQLQAFSARFGALDNAPINAIGRPWVEGYPKLAVMSNIERDGAPVGSLGYGEAVWHTDMSYNPTPPSAALLYAIEVTREGGETGFVSMHHALETLAPELAREIAGRQIKHDASRDSSGTLRKGFEAVSDPRDATGALHPIVSQHPVSGRNALYLGRRPFAYIVGMPLDESEDLLDRLWAHATDERQAWFQTWAVGDLLIWDNRSVMHTRRAFDGSERRYLLRTQIAGAAPLPAG